MPDAPAVRAEPLIARISAALTDTPFWREFLQVCATVALLSAFGAVVGLVVVAVGQAFPRFDISFELGIPYTGAMFGLIGFCLEIFARV